MAETPLVFDFDGVVLDSVGVKTRAFAALFEREGLSVRDRVVAHHLANGGLSRFEKFRWIYREILERPLSAAEEAALGDRFNALVEDEVMRAAFIPGALEFIRRESPRRALHLASGTPEEELRRIVDKRGLSRFFKGVFGSPKKKDAILREIARIERLPVQALTMIGDAKNDLDAARAVGCRFIGVGSGFAGAEGVTVLADLRGLEAALSRADEHRTMT